MFLIEHIALDIHSYHCETVEVIGSSYGSSYDIKYQMVSTSCSWKFTSIYVSQAEIKHRNIFPIEI